MTTKPLTRLLSMLVAVLVANCAAADDTPQVVPLGDNTYSITVKATHKFTRNTEKLKTQAMDAATQFCAKEGKVLKVVSVTEDKSMYLVGSYSQSTLTFKALSPGDPELAPATDDHPKPPPAMNADLLTSELTKLDDLRKKGLLTDEEFAAAKKKLLDRL
jgi:hypothetical protein